MEYPRYKPIRTRPPGRGAFSDFTAAVLSGSVITPKPRRPYRSWRKSATPLPEEEKIEA